MQLGGTIVSKDFPVQIKGSKGMYEGWKIKYQTDEGEVKDLTRPSQSFTVGPLASGLKASFDALSVGDKFNYVIEKEGAFWELKSMNKGELVMPFKKGLGFKPSGGFKNDPQIQKYIIRQSSISSAVAALKMDKTQLDYDQIVELAGKFEEWVHRDA